MTTKLTSRLVNTAGLGGIATVDGNPIFLNNASITGNLIVSNRTILNNGITTTGNVQVTGNVIVANTSITNTGITTSDSLTVTGTLTATGTVTGKVASTGKAIAMSIVFGG